MSLFRLYILCYVNCPLVKGNFMELAFFKLLVDIITAVVKDGVKAAGIRRAVHKGRTEGKLSGVISNNSQGITLLAKG